LILISLLAVATLICIASTSGYVDHSAAVSTDNINNEESLIFRRSPYIIGHIHIAKTGGTSLNGELALNYENVCGNKGYSFDNYLVNERLKTGKDWKTVKDSYSNEDDPKSNRNRGKVPLKIANEIGYHDCDYISVEGNWEFWNKFDLPPFDTIPMELHLPCRDPIDHLMSQCNHRFEEIYCDEIQNEPYNHTMLRNQLNPCLNQYDGIGERFNKALLKYKTTSIKCYDYEVQFSKYLDYAASKLQKKRIQSQYVHRDSNARKRDKGSECIWNDEYADVKEKVLKFLLKNVDYYKFCNQCLGSENDLFA